MSPSAPPPPAVLSPVALAPASSASDAVRRAVDDPARLAAVAATGLLDAGSPDAAHERLAGLASRLLRAPLATVTLVAADRQVYSACVGFPAEIAAARQSPLEMSFCRFAVADAMADALGPAGVLAIDDTTRDPRTRAMPSVTDYGVRAYAGAPILVDEQPVGTLCVMDVAPRAWTADDLATLADLALAAAAEAKLRAANRRLEAERRRAVDANAAKAQFLANMSHELRTPLNAIGGFAQLLEMGVHGPVTEAQREALGRLTRAQQHLLGLINDLLNYARLESGRVEYDVRPVPVAAVLDEVAPLLGPQMAAGAVTLDVLPPAPGPDGAPLAVWADRDKLRQVLLNLLSNAAKFTGPGGRVTVDVAARRPDAPPGGEATDGVVFLRVRDTGRGIPRDQHEAVFEPFVQVGKRFAGERAGTGLGLTISRDLARGMGGDLRVRSEEGRGATFTVTLRRAAAA